MPKFSKFSVLTWACFFLPLLELFLLRKLFRFLYLPIRVLKGGYYTADAALLLVFIVIAIRTVFLRHESPREFSLRKNAFRIHLALLVIFAGTLMALSQHRNFLPFLEVIAVLISISSPLIFISFKKFIRPFRIELGSSFFIMASAALVLSYAHFSTVYWKFFAYISLHITRFLLSIFRFDITFDFVDTNKMKSYLLRAESFKCYIGRTCSGAEGIFVYLFTLLLLKVFIPEIKKGAILILALLAVPYSLFWNALRLSFLTATMEFVKRNHYPKSSETFFFELFHSQTGVFLYLIGIIVLFVPVIFYSTKRASLPGRKR